MSQILYGIGPGDNENFQPIKMNEDGEVKVTAPTIAPSGFDKMEITAFTGDGSPQTVVYSKDGVVLSTWTFTYNVDGDFQKAEKA